MLTQLAKQDLQHLALKFEPQLRRHVHVAGFCLFVHCRTDTELLGLLSRPLLHVCHWLVSTTVTWTNHCYRDGWMETLLIPLANLSLSQGKKTHLLKTLKHMPIKNKELSEEYYNRIHRMCVSAEIGDVICVERKQQLWVSECKDK